MADEAPFLKRLWEERYMIITVAAVYAATATLLYLKNPSNEHKNPNPISTPNPIPKPNSSDDLEDKITNLIFDLEDETGDDGLLRLKKKDGILYFEIHLPFIDPARYDIITNSGKGLVYRTKTLSTGQEEVEISLANNPKINLIYNLIKHDIIAYLGKLEKERRFSEAETDENVMKIRELVKSRVAELGALCRKVRLNHAGLQY